MATVLPNIRRLMMIGVDNYNPPKYSSNTVFQVWCTTEQHTTHWYVIG